MTLVQPSPQPARKRRHQYPAFSPHPPLSPPNTAPFAQRCARRPRCNLSHNSSASAASSPLSPLPPPPPPPAASPDELVDKLLRLSPALPPPLERRVRIAAAECALPPTAAALLDVLFLAAVSCADFDALVARLGLLPVLALRPSRVALLLQALASRAALSTAERGHLLAQQPQLLNVAAEDVTATLDALHAAGLRRPLISRVVVSCPLLLLVPATHVARCAACLAAPPIAVGPALIPSVVRRTPDLLVLDADSQIKPVAAWLARTLRSDCLRSIVVANPDVLAASPAALAELVAFLDEHVPLSPKHRNAALRMFPKLLTTSVDEQIEPVIRFLLQEVGLSETDLPRVVRAFPAILARDIAADMRPAVQYFRSCGIRNVARIVSRLPAVLGYDLQTEIVPKVEYIRHVLGIGVFNVLVFPGLLSYSLEDVIEPRTMFMLWLGKSVTRPRLSRVITPTDDMFCKQVAKVPPQSYRAFRERLQQQKKRCA